MKKKILSFALAILMLTSCLLLSGCLNSYQRYLAVVPTDRPYHSTLNYTMKSERDNYDMEYDYTVIRKSATVAGETRDVIYINYSRVNNLNHYYDTEYTLLFVAGKSFYLDGSTWQRDVSSYKTKWSEVYGSMSNPGTYVYMMTQPINGRNFYDKYKTAETSEYLEYTFNYDEETFRISNNMYHVLLNYHIKTDVHEENHVATLVLEESPTTIPHLGTITAEMLA